MLGYLVICAVAAVASALGTWLVIRLAPYVGAVAVPTSRSVHTRPMPTMGGVGMFLGFLVALGVASQLHQFREMFRGTSEAVGIVLAAGIMVAVGALDDLRDVSPPAKIAGQVFSGSVLSLFGTTMLYFRIPFVQFDYVVLSPDLAPIITVVTVVVMANAMNLIDGLDGLAAGIALIAGFALFLYADRLFKAGLLEGSNIGPLIAIITVGVCAGFLPFNFNPARVFMGDAGSMFLGLLLAVCTITIGGRIADQFSGQTYFFFAPLFIPLVILGVPLIDTVFSFLRRLVRRQSFAVADKDHLHHRLMRLGHGPRRAVAILWLWTAVLSALVLVPTYSGRGNALVPVGVFALALVLYGFLHPGLRSAREAAELAQHPSVSARPQEEIVDLVQRRRSRR